VTRYSPTRDDVAIMAAVGGYPVGIIGRLARHPACSRRPPRPKLEIPAVTSWRANVDTSFAADAARTMYS
jgi:hypothetical protein